MTALRAFRGDEAISTLCGNGGLGQFVEQRRPDLLSRRDRSTYATRNQAA
jgi:hypothetical protein